MNTLTATILWTSVQVALFSLLGSAAFLVLRRRGPSAAATCAATILCVMLPLTIFAFSPWPDWSLAGASRSFKTSASNATELSEPMATSSTKAADDGSLKDNFSTTLATWWQTAVNWTTAASGAIEQPTRPWRAWLPWVIAAGIGLAAARLGLGLLSVWNLRRRSKALEDHNISALTGEIAAALGVSPIAVRESTQLRSAATIGWRRPLLLLPAGWRAWTEAERRAVLAHELAHVARRDYLTVLLARLTTAIHFYQPLVLWLNRQLRVQQELAADSRAAAVVGNRQNYLRTLAEMALRADEQAIPWAARAFLPGTSMLVRRIDWLKKKNAPIERSLGRWSRWLLAATMVAVALGVAGIRVPRGMETSLALAAPPPAGDQQPSGTASTASAIQPIANYIPADALMVGMIRPNKILLEKTASAFTTLAQPAFDEFAKRNGIKLTELESATAVRPKDRMPNIFAVILRAQQPCDWKSVIAAQLGKFETKDWQGHAYYLDPRGANGPAIAVVDERTMIYGTESQVKEVITGTQHPQIKQFAGMGDSDVFVWLDIESLRQAFEAAKAQEGVPNLLLLLMPLVKQTSNVVITAKMDDGSAVVRAQIDCPTADDVEQVTKTLEAARTLAINLMNAQRPMIEKAAAAESAPADLKDIAMQAFDSLRDALASVKITTDDSTLTVETKLQLPQAAAMALVLPAVAAGREAAMRTQSMNNLKQLALGMLNYEDAKKRFPTSVMVGPDDKSKHSWRVAILPFIEQMDLYKQYHLDEPWDSENNKKLIDKMPRVFRDPHDEPSSTSSAYYMPTGKGTFGGSETGLQMKEITDGTSNTIMLVDANRGIPWTKPEDIEVDPDKPLPKFGGHLSPQGLAIAAYADGHIHLFTDGVDPKTLHALFTVAGGETVDPNASQRGKD